MATVLKDESWSAFVYLECALLLLLRFCFSFCCCFFFFTYEHIWTKLTAVSRAHSIQEGEVIPLWAKNTAINRTRNKTYARTNQTSARAFFPQALFQAQEQFFILHLCLLVQYYGLPGEKQLERAQSPLAILSHALRAQTARSGNPPLLTRKTFPSQYPIEWWRHSLCHSSWIIHLSIFISSYSEP